MPLHFLFAKFSSPYMEGGVSMFEYFKKGFGLCAGAIAALFACCSIEKWFKNRPKEKPEQETPETE